jgi:hypothetical protein
MVTEEAWAVKFSHGTAWMPGGKKHVRGLEPKAT